MAAETGYTAQPLGDLDLYPQDEDQYDALLKWCLTAFQAADDARRPHEDRWRRYYKLSRNHVPKRKPGEWRSRVFVPMIFQTIETITPALTASLPKFVANPFGPEDVETAEGMTELMGWATRASKLYIERVKAARQALRYGTGIMKSYYKVTTKRARRAVPIMEPIRETFQVPVPDPDNPLLTLKDADGNDVVETREEVVGEVPVGTRMERYTYKAYEGPAAMFVDIFNFWAAPEAEEIEDARYVVHRSYQEWSAIQRRIDEGIYHLPENLTAADVMNTADDAHLSRLGSIDLGGIPQDSTRRPVELLEFWTDDGRVITMANRKCLLRVQENPFDHGEKPFVKIVDHLNEGEFWGTGEAEFLEGLQDLQNMIVNSRVDNLRLVMNKMFAVNVNNLDDLRDLTTRPGGVIRVKGDLQPKDVIQPVDLGDVTESAFAESAQIRLAAQEASGNSDYQMGMSSAAMNDTATGVAMLTERGQTRFTHKARLAELMGDETLARHFGSMIQQFTTEPKMVRLMGDKGQQLFKQFDPASLQGQLDFSIEAQSTTQSDTVKKEQALSLFAQLVQIVGPMGQLKLIEDVLEAFGKKNVADYVQDTPGMMMAQQGLLPDGTPMPGMLPPGEEEQGGEVIPLEPAQ